jgi:hypothetical protein
LKNNEKALEDFNQLCELAENESDELAANGEQEKKKAEAGGIAS